MAATLKPSDAFDLAKIYVKNMKLDDVKLRILDDVSKYMWMAAPWRWTIGSLASFNLAANTQDYTIANPASPNDFLYLSKAYVSDSNSKLVQRDLIVEATLPTTTDLLGQPNRIAFAGYPDATHMKLRIAPVPAVATFGAGGTNLVISEYKKIAPVIASGNVGTAGTLVFDDEWFWVYVQGVLWMSYLYADDDRAGQVTYADGKTQYTGLRASFEDGLQFMRRSEKLHIPAREKEA